MLIRYRVALALLGFAFACGGGGEGTSATAGVSSVAVSVASTQLVVGQTTTATAILRDAGGSTLTGRGVAWSASPASIASVKPTGEVTALTVGTATITATSEGKSGVASIVVSLPPVAQVEVSFPATRIVEGRSAQATVVLRDASQQPLVGRVVTWTTSAPSIASVTGAGVVTAIAAGTATITASSEGKTGSFSLIVDRPLAVTGTDALLQPGKLFSLTGSGLSVATVSIGGIVSPVASATDATLSVTVPVAPWTPCMGPNDSLSVTVRTPAGDTLTLLRPAQESPTVLNLAAGAYAEISGATLGKCRIAPTNAGTYLALPFMSERPDLGSITPSESVSVSVRVDGLASSALLPGARSTSMPNALGRSSRDIVRRHAMDDFTRTSPSRVVGGQACPLPPLGGTVTVNSQRDRQGRLQYVMIGGGVPDENWTVIAMGQTIAVLTDTATLRLSKSDARWAKAFDDLVALADTGVVPFLQANSRGIPDDDGNGKLIAYVTGVADIGNDISFVYSMRSDCPAGSGAGESILLDWTPLLAGAPFVSPNSVVSTIARIADIGWRDHVRSGSWAIDGFGRLMANLYLVRSSPDPLSLNLTHTPLDASSQYAYCTFRLRDAFAAGTFNSLWTLVLGCDMMGYMFQQYHAKFGGTLKDAVVAWSKVPITTTMEDADTYFQQPRGATRSFPHWLLSWYADDYVAGVPQELTQSMWNLRQLWRNEWGSLPFTAPDIALGPTSPAASFKLGAPDARFIEFVAPSGAVIGVTRSGPLASEMGFFVLRAK